MNVYKFPKNFKWGSATSSHQIEGDNRNDWSEWETSKLRVESLKLKGLDPKDFISGKACDSYNRYEEDFDIAKKLNQNIHRFSIEWSRIEPEDDRFDEKEMQHYVNIVKALRDRGIEPMITLWHFTNPIWFAEKGGFLNVNSPEYFTRYVKYVVNNLKDQVGLWITFNEATTVYGGFAYLKGLWPPQHKNIFEWKRVNKNIVRSHTEAYKEIKKIYNQSSPAIHESSKAESQRFLEVTEVEPLYNKVMSHNVEVGLVESNTYSVGGNNFYERIVERIYNYYRNLYSWTKAFPYYDFLGLNYYHVDRRIPGSFISLPKQEMDPEMNWEIYPKGIYYVLKQLTRFKRPIYITENGTADVKDLTREKFIKDHLYWIHKAIQNGVDIRGYLYWSLLDNFEWAHGYKPKFGLVEVDFNNFERHIRPSALEYAKICLTNQLEID